MEAAGRPLLGWSLAALEAAETIAAIVIAAPPGEERRAAAVAEEAGVEAAVVPGGATRSESVAAGLAATESELVAVHDAARPLLTAGLVDEIVAKLVSRPDADAVIAAAPITDTVKRAREPRPEKGEFPRGGPTVVKTESRDHLWSAQTPQVFRAEALREALGADAQAIAAATDDAMLVERAGGKVLMHPSPPDNLKVTSQLELRLAELLLADRR